ncbi:MAG: VWA domain-containing protein [Clostridia bacterium]
MKLQNMTVIFIIIMIPIILVVSYYIGLQINTITMQKNYTVKLQTAAKDSIQALEINTVEWNSASSNLADSKRRDVLAAINTFTTSLANGMGIGGAGKGRIQTYIPAIVYTMYDGYYIYSASLMKDQDTTSEGLTQFNEDGTIKSNETSSYQYILKPYSPYSARYARYASANGSIDVTVNYTLDNYIRVYGTVNGEYQAKEGYLVVCDSNSNEGVNNVKNGRISKIKYRGAEIKPETLKENVYIVGEEVKEYPYIYDQYDNKLYWDGSNYFSVDKYNNKVYLQEALPEGDAGFSITNRFRKISIPVENRQGELTVQKVFQILNPGGGYYFYFQDESGNLQLYTRNNLIGEVEVKNEQDFSAINYCVESYVFTNWVTKKLSSITVRNMQSPTGGQYNNVDKDANIFEISKDNNPDPENDDAYAKSVLAQHKKDIIINTIEKNLSQATAQAQEMNPNYEYRLPQLSYDEWEQALSNISIIAFMQGMPIGLKYYNNYAIATSTLNKEFVDPDELYFAGKDDQYYHQRQCEQATGSDYVGYRSIDYVAKSYEKSNNGTTSTTYYYPHANNTNSELECYYCLVNRSTYKNNEIWNGNLYRNWTDSYYNALARERYMQLDDIEGKSITDISIAKNVDETTKYYGKTIKYEIQVTNKSTGVKTFDIVDEFNKNINDFISNISINASYRIEDEKIIIENVTLEAGASKTITIEGNVIGNVGIYKNTAKVTVDEKEFKSTEVSVSVVKDVTIIANSIMKPANVVFIIDASGSMTNSKKRPVENAVKSFVNKMDINSDSMIGFSRFRSDILGIDATKRGKSPYKIEDRESFIEDFKWTTIPGWTNFKDGLRVGVDIMEDMIKEKPNNKKIAIFLSDGSDTKGKYSGYASKLKEIADEVFAIKYGKFDTNETTLKEIASKQENYYNSENIESIFNEIFGSTIINIDRKIEGSTLISKAELIGSEGEAGEGNWWISLKNDSEFDFRIDDTNESEIANRALIIKEDETTRGEKTIGEWSREGYIGKANGYIYLNLSKFGAESKITIEIKN